jgi:hypothetical protein
VAAFYESQDKIVEDLRAALEEFELILGDLSS